MTAERAEKQRQREELVAAERYLRMVAPAWKWRPERDESGWGYRGTREKRSVFVAKEDDGTWYVTEGDKPPTRTRLDEWLECRESRYFSIEASGAERSSPVSNTEPKPNKTGLDVLREWA